VSTILNHDHHRLRHRLSLSSNHSHTMSTPAPQTPRMITDGSAAPTLERSLTRQVVLEEDEYTGALSHIIARDFFPSLVHLDATNAYLDAVAAADPAAIGATVRRLEALQTPGPTPRATGPSDTPRVAPLEPGARPAKRARLDEGLGLRLDAFQARYTSEDNASFAEIVERENTRRRERHGWAWDAQRRVEEQCGRMLEARERALIEAPTAPGVRERVLIEAPAPRGLITAGEAMNVDVSDVGAVVAVRGNGKEKAVAEDEEMEEVDVMAPLKDTRPAGVDGWEFRARNSLMFLPDADAPSHNAHRPAALAKGDPKVIKHSNTRLPEQEEGPTAARRLSAPPSPTRSRIDAAIVGEPCASTLLFLRCAPSDVFGACRPTKVARRRRIFLRPRHAVADAVRARARGREAVDDDGHTPRHATRARARGRRSRDTVPPRAADAARGALAAPVRVCLTLAAHQGGRVRPRRHGPAAWRRRHDAAQGGRTRCAHARRAQAARPHNDGYRRGATCGGDGARGGLGRREREPEGLRARAVDPDAESSREAVRCAAAHAA
jgi:hypothetical protein